VGTRTWRNSKHLHPFLTYFDSRERRRRVGFGGWGRSWGCALSANTLSPLVLILSWVKEEGGSLGLGAIEQVDQKWVGLGTYVLMSQHWVPLMAPGLPNEEKPYK